MSVRWSLKKSRSEKTERQARQELRQRVDARDLVPVREDEALYRP